MTLNFSTYSAITSFSSGGVFFFSSSSSFCISSKQPGLYNPQLDCNFSLRIYLYHQSLHWYNFSVLLPEIFCWMSLVFGSSCYSLRCRGVFNVSLTVDRGGNCYDCWVFSWVFVVVAGNVGVLTLLGRLF